MRPAALPTTAPDARSIPGRGAETPSPDDGFDAALAQLATPDTTSTKTGTTAVLVASASAPSSVATSVKPIPGRDVAALLAKLVGATTTGLADLPGPLKVTGTATAGSATDNPKDANDAKDAATAATLAVADPLASMAALLPGLVAAPVPAVATPAAPPAESAKLAAALGAVSKATTPRGQDEATRLDDATASSNEPDVGLTLVATETHLAPASVPTAQGQSRGAAVAATTPDPVVAATSASTPSAASPSVAATGATSSRDAAPTDAVVSRPEPEAQLPAGTLPAIAGAVTNLAAATASTVGATESEPAAATPTATQSTSPSVAPARSLTLQLTPGDLGSVTVRLHLTAGGLDVHLAVEDHKTLAAISHARDDLAAAIGDNGYRVESLVIRGTDASSTSTAGSNDSARSQSESGGGQGASSGGSGGSGGDASSSRQRAPQPSAGSRDSARAHTDDGVFV